jgi:hypothetical protein
MRDIRRHHEILFSRFEREYTAMISVRQIYGYVVLHLILKDKDSSRKEDE